MPRHLTLIHAAHPCVDCGRTISDPDEYRCFDCYITWKYAHQGPECWPTIGYWHPDTGERVRYDPTRQR